jgi:hypothetical protein
LEAGLPGGRAESRVAVARAGGRGVPAARLRFAAGDIRVYDDVHSRRSAARLGVWGYAWRGDVFLGAGLDHAGGPRREEVLGHEVRHAIQQRRGTNRRSAHELEREAGQSGDVSLAADPGQVLGFAWVIPIVVGLYILLRPNVANAPAPGEKTYPSVSTAQVGAEALALALPMGFTGVLARAGFGVVGAFAITGAASSVGVRGVRDVAAGSFSGGQAYVVDALTGAVIGVIVGGVFRLTPAGRELAEQAGLAGRNAPALTHFTSVERAPQITAEGVLRGRQGIYALESTAEAETPAMRALRATMSTRTAQVPIRIPSPALSQFTRPVPIGPVSAFQRLMGVWRAPAGAINLTGPAAGLFTPTGEVLPNLTGQFLFPYGADVGIAIAGGTGISLIPGSVSEEEARSRSLFSAFVSASGGQSFSGTVDGPIVVVHQAARGETAEPAFTADQMLSGQAPGLSPGATPLISPQLGPTNVIFVTPLYTGPLPAQPPEDLTGQ